MDLTSDDKLRATTISHPNAAAVVAPRAIERARGSAQLTRDAHAAARIDAAIVRVAVIGFTRDVEFAAITIATVSAAMMSAEDEFGAASVIDPDTAVVISPRAAFDATSLAELTRELHAEMRVGGAPVTMAVLRFANDRFVTLRENGRGDPFVMAGLKTIANVKIKFFFINLTYYTLRTPGGTSDFRRARD